MIQVFKINNRKYFKYAKKKKPTNENLMLLRDSKDNLLKRTFS